MCHSNTPTGSRSSWASPQDTAERGPVTACTGKGAAAGVPGAAGCGAAGRGCAGCGAAGRAHGGLACDLDTTPTYTFKPNRPRKILSTIGKPTRACIRWGSRRSPSSPRRLAPTHPRRCPQPARRGGRLNPRSRPRSCENHKRISLQAQTELFLEKNVWWVGGLRTTRRLGARGQRRPASHGRTSGRPWPRRFRGSRCLPRLAP